MTTSITPATTLADALREAEQDRAVLAEILNTVEPHAHNAAVLAWNGNVLLYNAAIRRGLGMKVDE